MSRYRKKAVEVDAKQFTGGNHRAIREWQEELGATPGFRAVQMSDPRVQQGVYAEIYDYLHDTWVGVKPHQFIIRGVSGEFYPVDEKVFADTYEKVI